MKVRKMNVHDSKCLIACFSRSGSNYVSGRIMDLPVGNTEVVAKMIQDMTEGDLFHIEAVNAYPEDYTETTEIAQQELRANARPKLSSHLEILASYDVIFLGYPNWYGTMPVFTFLEDYNFSGKTIAPFCTHEGSAWGGVWRISKKCARNQPSWRVLPSAAAT